MHEPTTSIRVTRRYHAAPVRVFDAWLVPQLAGLWLFATASRPMAAAAIDARAGGAFCFTERRAGALIEHRGQYIEIARPRRLAFRLRSPDCAAHDTRVSIALAPLPAGCELAVLHEALPAARASHVQARWIGMLYGLESVLARSRAGETI